MTSTRAAPHHPSHVTPALILGLLLLAAAPSAQTLLTCSLSNGPCNRISTFDSETGACSWSVELCEGLVVDGSGDIACTLESQASVRIQTVDGPGSGTCSNAVEDQIKQAPLQWYLGSTPAQSCNAQCLAETGSAANCNPAAMNAVDTTAKLRSVAAFLGVPNADSIPTSTGALDEYPGWSEDRNRISFASGGSSTCEAVGTTFNIRRFCCCSQNILECPTNPSA
mmetsp:Transcript_19838/g.52732  ORF Transcript_19838/g.52732 Transcript_19838/m.52732 type:complete len:225 (+) Transcript_19838:113-787(+)